MKSLTEEQIETLRWLDQLDGVTPVVDDVHPRQQEILAELVKAGLVAELRNERRWGGDGDVVAWRLLPNPEWIP